MKLIGSLSQLVLLIPINPSIRSYLILRPKDFSDPDPKLATVLLHIWPWMVVVTFVNLTLLVGIAGLAGPYIFPGLLILYGINYATLRVLCKVEIQTGDPEDPNHGQDDFAKEHQSFIAMAALTSLWLPSVVGHQSQRIFLVSGIVSLVSKVLLLGVSVAFVYSGLNPRPFLIFCFPESSPVINQTGVRTCKYSEDLCGSPKNWTHEIRVADALSAANEAVFNYERILKDIDSPKTEFEDFHKVELNISSAYLAHIRGSKAWIDKTLKSAGVGKVQQKIRICEKNETPFRLCILSGLLVVLALAAYATYRLHRIADYRVF